MSGGHFVQPPCSSRVTHSCLPRMVTRQFFNTCLEGDSTTYIKNCMSKNLFYVNRGYEIFLHACPFFIQCILRFCTCSLHVGQNAIREVSSVLIQNKKLISNKNILRNSISYKLTNILWSVLFFFSFRLSTLPSFVYLRFFLDWDTKKVVCSFLPSVLSQIQSHGPILTILQRPKCISSIPKALCMKLL